MEYKNLVQKALEAKTNSYAPYSSFKVGAAVLTANHNIYTGVNVENSSFGATICAERAAVVKAVSEGEQKIIAIAIASDSDEYTFPCGICRQVLAEFGDSTMKIISADKNGNYEVYNLEYLMPNAFEKKSMARIQKQRL